MTNEWHQLPAGAVADALETADGGLSAEEAARRLTRWGPNELETVARVGRWRRFGRQLNNVLLYVLLSAAGLTALLGQWLDTGVIVGVVLINALIGYLQEGRAEQALESIRKLLNPRAAVLRDGEPVEVDAHLLVPGDVVLLGAGDRVPADLRLSHARNLEIDESILSGESIPVAKDTEPLAPDTEVSNRSNMAFAGTLVTRGVGRGYVTATGGRSELGAISHLLGSVQSLTTPLLAKISRFGRRLAVLILVLAGAVAAFGVVVRDLPVAEMLLAAVGIAVAAIPEGLPPVMTIALAIGVQLMARRHAIVRRLPAVETLGEVNVICTDKTGTLTTSEMTVCTVLLAEHELEVTGAGFRPTGVITEKGAAVEEALADLDELLLAGCCCNDSSLVHEHGEWQVVGDPTEGALLTLAEKAGFDHEASGWRRLDSIPFESERRFMATLCRGPAGDRRIFVKGAPEAVLALCRPDTPEIWEDRAAALAARGQRVLALAERPPDAHLDELTLADVTSQLTLLGLVGVADPPRGEVRRALRECSSAGIRVLMITGDHASTARAVSRELGLGRGERVLTGADLDAMAEADFAAAAAEVDVFARVSPKHKLRLVRALQDQGQIVAMTGDGVNDAPALKRADIGIAMGIKGTEAARRAAEIVLANDDFSTIVDAVRLGRGIYDNIRKSIVFLLPTSMAEALVIATAILLGLELPITPVQILWVNMITAVTLGIALAFEPAESDVMQRDPRVIQAPILSALALWRTASVSLLMLSGVLALYFIEHVAGASLDYTRTVCVDALVTFEAVYLISSRRLTASAFDRAGWRDNPVLLLSVLAVMIFQLLYTYVWPLDVLFAAEPLSGASWLRIGAAAALLLTLVEVEKRIRSLWTARRTSRAATSI